VSILTRVSERVFNDGAGARVSPRRQRLQKKRRNPSEMPSIAIALACLFLFADPLAAQKVPSAARSDSLPPDEWLAADKAAHVFAGFWSAGAGYAAAGGLDVDRDGRRTAAITVGIAAGLAKEAFDRWAQEERFSWKDLAADGVGIALLVAVTTAAEP
jgi:uncharacterized protein YfiM (DUF2279 family)